MVTVTDHTRTWTKHSLVQFQKPGSSELNWTCLGRNGRTETRILADQCEPSEWRNETCVEYVETSPGRTFRSRSINLPVAWFKLKSTPTKFAFCHLLLLRTLNIMTVLWGRLQRGNTSEILLFRVKSPLPTSTKKMVQGLAFIRTKCCTRRNVSLKRILCRRNLIQALEAWCEKCTQLNRFPGLTFRKFNNVNWTTSITRKPQAKKTENFSEI